VGDVAVWDNRCLLHRGHAWDLKEPRVMKHTRIAGDGENEWALDE
jgi:alpha-ketoglutarate-dependent taurine dioxygenase